MIEFHVVRLRRRVIGINCNFFCSNIECSPATYVDNKARTRLDLEMLIEINGQMYMTMENDTIVQIAQVLNVCASDDILSTNSRRKRYSYRIHPKHRMLKGWGHRDKSCNPTSF